MERNIARVANPSVVVEGEKPDEDEGRIEEDEEGMMTENEQGTGGRGHLPNDEVYGPIQLKQ